jgi:hypothetical protein
MALILIEAIRTECNLTRNQGQVAIAAEFMYNFSARVVEC